jgi:site-specific recombinase XerD
VEAISEIERLRHDDSVARYLTSISHRSPRTIATYRDLLRTLQNNIEVSLDLAAIDDLVLLFARLNEHYQESTLNVMKAALKGFLRFCGRDDDAKLIKYASLKWMPRSDLAQEQLDKVLAHAKPNERALILTFYSTGARLGELCGKRWEKERPKISDLDWVGGRIYIIGKGERADCLVFLPRREQALEALRKYLGARRSGSIFQCRWRAWRLVRRAGQRVGVKLHPHMLRHAGATSLIMQGVSTRIVQAWLRHASLEMTERYTHVAKSDLIALAKEKEWR